MERFEGGDLNNDFKNFNVRDRNFVICELKNRKRNSRINFGQRCSPNIWKQCSNGQESGVNVFFFNGSIFLFNEKMPRISLFYVLSHF